MSTFQANPPGIHGDERLARAIEHAESLGHTVECDAPGFRRYTCTKCPRALLMPEGVVYGSALTERCRT